MLKLCSLGLAVPQKAFIIKMLSPLALYGSQVGGLADRHLQSLRVAARAGLSNGASLRRAAKLELVVEGLVADPQDQAMLRAWACACDRGRRWPRMPFVRAKGGAHCVLSLFLPPVLGGNCAQEWWTFWES